MKKILALATILCTIATLVGCGSTEEPKVHTRYVAQGRYYTDGTIITNDGNEWAYSTDTISDKTPFDGIPINIGFDDNGTPDDIYDDVVLGVTWDVATNIYDELETALSDKFDLDREGNNIKINFLG